MSKPNYDKNPPCRRCGRALTVPSSIKEGIGPICKQLEKKSVRADLWDHVYGREMDATAVGQFIGE